MPLLLAVPLLLCLNLSARAEEAFEVRRFDDPGRTILAEFADLNGDGRTDLLQVVMRGIPPEQERVIFVRLQAADGTLPNEASFEVPSPANAAAYDIGDLRDTPGVELLLLRGHDLLILSLASADAPHWSLPIPGGTSVGAAEDDRGLEQFRMIFDDFGDEPWILVPLFDEMLVLSPQGALVSRMSMPARANFYIPPKPGFYFGESDIQLFFDGPRISVGDVDGDGRADVTAATRHEIRVFLRQEEGFSEQPQRQISLRLVTEKDHIRGSGGVTAEARDVNGDKRLDLLVSHTQGSFADAHSTTNIYLNRDGEWDRDNPVGTFESRGAIAGDMLVDLDGDGLPELIRTEIPMSVLEVVELLVTRAIDARVRIHSFSDGRFGKKPDAQLKLDLPISFDTFRSAGFLPQVHIDVNGDGAKDMLLGEDGDRLEVRLGGQDSPFDERASTQRVSTSGEIRSGDLDDDGLPELLIFNPQKPGASLQLLLNRGVLPGTPPRMSATP